MPLAYYLEGCKLMFASLFLLQSFKCHQLHSKLCPVDIQYHGVQRGLAPDMFYGLCAKQ